VRELFDARAGPAAGNGEDKPADWHVQTGKDPVPSLFRENVAECLARVINIGEDAGLHPTAG
jgi:hypothetical protein